MREFVKSLKRLYNKNMICKEKVITIFNDNKITKEEMEYILEYEQSK